MNAAVTVALGPGTAKVLIGPEVPIKDQMAAMKGRKLEIPPDAEKVEIWTRNSGVIKRQRVKNAVAVELDQQLEQSQDAPAPASDADEPKAEKKKAARKKKD